MRVIAVLYYCDQWLVLLVKFHHFLLLNEQKLFRRNNLKQPLWNCLRLIEYGKDAHRYCSLCLAIQARSVFWNGIGIYKAAFCAFVVIRFTSRKQHFFIGWKGYKRWIYNFSRQFFIGEFAGFQVKTVNINSFTALICVSANLQRNILGSWNNSAEQ